MQKPEDTSPALLAPPPDATRGLVLFLGALYLTVILARAPELWTAPRFWAEEGTVYFLEALSRPWWSAVTYVGPMGYFSLLPNLAGLMATWVPLEAAPAVTQVVSALALLSVPLALATAQEAQRRPGTIMLVAVLMLVAPASDEIWLNSATAQFHLCLATATVIAFPGQSGRRALWLRRGVVLAAGLTSPSALFVAPFCLLRLFGRHRAEYRWHLLMLGLGGAVHAWTMLTLPPALGRKLGLGWLVVEAAAVKNALMVFAGRDVAKELMHGGDGQPNSSVLPLVTVGAATVWALSIWAILRSRQAAAVWLLAMAGTVAILSYVSALGQASLLYPLFAHRYAYGPNALYMAALAMAIQGAPAGRVRVTLLALTTLSGVMGLIGFWQMDGVFREGPRWRDEVAAWRQDPSHQLQIWPNWGLPLPALP